VYFHSEDTERQVNANKAKLNQMIKDGAFVKMFDKLQKDKIGKVSAKESKKMKLDLLDDYSHPAPLPTDLFKIMNYTNDQAYVMLSSPDIGK
jgi:hypothetical protein